MQRELKRTVQKLDQLDDFDMLLEQQRDLKNTSIAHLMINKSLFEIDANELSLKRKIGSGGSGSSVYLCEYNENLFAFKNFEVCRFRVWKRVTVIQ